MKKEMTRLTGIILAVLYLCSLAPYASGATETTSNERITIRFASSETNEEISQNSPIEQMMEEHYNVDFEFVYLTNEPQQQMNLLYAANDLPDYFSFNVYTQDFIQKATAKIEVDEVKQHMPEYWEYMEGKTGGTFENYLVDRWIPEGADLRTLPNFMGSSGIPFASFIRMDKVRELGIDEVPTTVAEFEEILRRWKEQFGTYPLNYRGDTLWQTFNEVFPAYNIALDWWKVVDGSMMFENVRPNAKLALAICADWYEKGYVNPEYVTYKDNSVIDPQFENGEILTRHWQDFWRVDPDNTDPAQNMVLRLRDSGQPNAEIAVMPPLKSDQYPDIKPTWAIFEPLGSGSGLAYGAHLEENRDKLHRIMEIVDDMTFNLEVVKLYSFGVEGEDYAVSDDGSIKVDEKYINNMPALKARGIGVQAWNPFSWLTGALDMEKSPKRAEKLQNYLDLIGYDYATYRENFSINAVPGRLLDEDGNDLAIPNMVNVNEAYMKIITGVEPVDYFDHFVEEWYASGGQIQVDAANRMYLHMWE